jgi:hypothetical protein
MVSDGQGKASSLPGVQGGAYAPDVDPEGRCCARVEEQLKLDLVKGDIDDVTTTADLEAKHPELRRDTGVEAKLPGLDS